VSTKMLCYVIESPASRDGRILVLRMFFTCEIR
jgi:hypothetical protein